MRTSRYARMIPISAALVASVALTGAAGAHGKPSGAPKETTRQTLPGGSTGDAAAESYFTNTELIDQNGRAHRFYADLLLKRAGADLTREGLVRALETFRDVDAGPAPPLSFGRGRRTGVMGATIVRIDPAAGSVTRASGWLGVTP